ncbi:hypothetical protein PAXINDRAFT_22331 [Paxillus involutus ATCC 200175]|uniref:Unplaced genomic scaffold PAXINscaffold_2561, whole genome shotgun sequence n=1 Tax=Paxillus involutus ATCC 200175 TaxID=664439 RepID=A0A0C9SLG5_PAXIN|nr:hypothetical protein PAXINDRAFT_22331 [Paxillus involutus ATCC 200175]
MPSSQDDDGKVDNIRAFAHQDAVAKGERQADSASGEVERTRSTKDKRGRGKMGTIHSGAPSNGRCNVIGLRNAYNF